MLMNAGASAKFKIISGYPSSGEVLLALEKGEVDAASSLLSHQNAADKDWIEQKKVHILLSETVERSPSIPDIPAVGEMGCVAHRLSFIDVDRSKACRPLFSALTSAPG